MKVQVKDKQGIDEAGNKHPAPGIADGTHECELKWEAIKSLKTVGKFCTRQIWVLTEQDKEGEVIPDIELGEEIRFSYLDGDVIIYHNGEEIYSMDSTKIQSIINYLNYTQSSTRIAELEARVAELERVLREIASYTYPYSAIIKATRIATNALKN